MPIGLLSNTWEDQIIKIFSCCKTQKILARTYPISYPKHEFLMDDANEDKNDSKLNNQGSGKEHFKIRICLKVQEHLQKQVHEKKIIVFPPIKLNSFHPKFLNSEKK